MTKIEIQPTRAFMKHFKTTKKIVVSEGGGRSGKTYSILQILILYAIQNKDQLISVVAENLPFIRRGVLRDFKAIMQDIGFWIESQYRKGSHEYHFGNGSVIEFFSADNPGKALGAARDVLFINEANNVDFEIAFQLIGRTRTRIWIDYNPRSEFWAHTEIMQAEAFSNMFDFVHTTFHDNHYLEEGIKEVMMARAAKDENYRRVYVLGLIGNIVGLVFPKWSMVDGIPDDVSEPFYGLDWGYTNDPTAVVKCHLRGEDIFVKEMIYETRLQNEDIARLLKGWGVGFKEIYADSAEPKSIDFIYSKGFNIHPVEKGKDSVNYGIDLLKSKNIHVTKDSVNLIKELRNYTWKQDKNGVILNEPIDLHNHAIDAWRYAFMMKMKPAKKISYMFVGGRTNKL